MQMKMKLLLSRRRPSESGTARDASRSITQDAAVCGLFAALIAVGAFAVFCAGKALCPRQPISHNAKRLSQHLRQPLFHNLIPWLSARRKPFPDHDIADDVSRERNDPADWIRNIKRGQCPVHGEYRKNPYHTEQAGTG